MRLGGEVCEECHLQHEGIDDTDKVTLHRLLELCSEHGWFESDDEQTPRSCDEPPALVSDDQQ